MHMVMIERSWPISIPGFDPDPILDHRGFTCHLQSALVLKHMLEQCCFAFADDKIIEGDAWTNMYSQ